MLFAFNSFVCFSQEVEIRGKVIAIEDIEGVHIINITASKFTITDSQGEFLIPAKLNDTIIISGLKYVAILYCMFKFFISSYLHTNTCYTGLNYL